MGWGGGICRDTGSVQAPGERNWLGKYGSEQLFPFVTHSSLHPFTTTTNHAVKMTTPISCFVRSNIGYSPPNSRFRLSSRMLSPSPECKQPTQSGSNSACTYLLQELLLAKFGPLWSQPQKEIAMKPPHTLWDHRLGRTGQCPHGAGIRHFIFPCPRKTTREGRWLFGSLKLYMVAAASPAPGDAALPYFVLLYLGRMHFQQRCEYRSLHS